MRVTIVQHAGDYREAYRRIESTGQETYYAQRYSIDSVAALVSQGHSVTFITALTERPFDEVLENGVRAVGAGFTQNFAESLLTNLVAEHKPERLIINTPRLHLLRWATAQSIRTLTVLADSFAPKGLRDRIRNARLSGLLKKKSFEWVCNHGLKSCLSLRSIGINPDKIIPWDWPPMITPSPQAKQLQTESQLGVLYAGMIDEKKGIGDTVRALSILKKNGVKIRLRAVGGGDIDRFVDLAKTLGVEDRVEFLGLVPHASVLKEMQSADVVVVPSRHEYPEGFPMTIYETLCSRTPLVASDHPMFRANLQHDTNAWIFPAGDADALARGIQTLVSDAGRYERLSAASAEAWSRLQLPVKWGELLSRWLKDGDEDRAWLHEHRLSSGRYALERYK
jgi:glycosyltransferase involved in cell wall biosynthesis